MHFSVHKFSTWDSRLSGVWIILATDFFFLFAINQVPQASHYNYYLFETTLFGPTTRALLFFCLQKDRNNLTFSHAFFSKLSRHCNFVLRNRSIKKMCTFEFNLGHFVFDFGLMKSDVTTISQGDLCCTFWVLWTSDFLPLNFLLWRVNGSMQGNDKMRLKKLIAIIDLICLFI